MKQNKKTKSEGIETRNNTNKQENKNTKQT